jgi:hypothetical protein
MPRKAKPIHVFSQVKTITKHRYYPKIAVMDYFHNNRKTEIPFSDILKIESECEELIVTVKSTQIRTYYKRQSSAAKLRLCQAAA